MILNQTTNKYISGDTSPRGRILDRNYNVIVDNVIVKSIYYKKPSNISSKEEIEIVYKATPHLSLDYNNLSERNLKEFYMLLNEKECDDLITEEEYNALEQRKIKYQDIYELKIARINDSMLNKLTMEDNHAAYLYYLMNNGYYYDEKLILNKVSDEQYAFFSENEELFPGFFATFTWERVYPYGDAFRSILGSISTHDEGIPLDNKDFYLNLGYDLDDMVGVSGLEKQYDKILKGTKEVTLKKDNEEQIITKAKKGNDIVLSIDINIQREIENMLKEEISYAKGEANTDLYNKSFITIENPQTGEIIALAGMKYNNDDISDFSYGAITYAVTPGSVIKGASISVGYDSKVIDIGTVMEDSCIKFLFMPEKCSWKNLGLIDDLAAIKWSSNVYQYKIAMMVGGFSYSYNDKIIINPIAFDIYRNMFYQYGLGVKTGIDYPNEQTGVKGVSVAPDLLINFAIGQYDTYTPLQITSYISTIANNGVRNKTRFLKEVLDDDGKTLYKMPTVPLNTVKIEKKYIDRIKEGMHLVMESGTGVGFMNNKYNPSGKTGTSESFVDVDFDGIIDYPTISNTFAGYAPANNPIMAITAISPDIQNPSKGNFKSNINKRIASKSTDIFFKYYDEFGNKR